MLSLFKGGRHLSNLRTSEALIPPAYLGPLVMRKLSAGKPLLIVERDPPEVIRRKLPVPEEKVRILWVSTVEHPMAINPRDLYKLEYTILQDVSQRRSDVIINALEYLILETGLQPTLKFLAKVRDITLLNGSSVHVVTSNAPDERELALIKRVMGLLE